MPDGDRTVVILGSGPNRIGQGVEFDYCCVRAVLAFRELGLPDRHGELESRDGLHRLRHLRRALLRAADARGRARDRPRRAADGRGRAARRADAAPARARPRGGRRADPRHLARGHRRRRGPRPVRGDGPRARRARSRRAARRMSVEEAVGGRATASATRSWSGPRTCSAGARCRSSTTSTRSSATSQQAARVAPEHPVLIDRFLEDAFEADVDAICDGTRVRHRRRHAAHRGRRHPLRRLGLRPAAVPDHRGAGRGDAPAHPRLRPRARASSA